MTIQSLKRLNLKSVLSVAFACMFVLSLARIHLRVQTTLIGYEIGQFKKLEVNLLEQRANRKMELAKLTSRKHLRFMSENGDMSTSRAKSIVSNGENRF